MSQAANSSEVISKNLAISVKNVVKSYEGRVVVNKVDLDVYSGEIFALLGPNGAGKTTFVEILEGYRKRDSGEVSVLNSDPQTLGRNDRAWRTRIGIVLQSTEDGQDLTVGETVHHFSHYYPNPKDPDAVIELVGLTEQKNIRARNLSGGQRRRLDVALGIIGNPEILFLDEPTTGFDPQARRSFWELIRNLKAAGTTIVLTTHYLDEAEALADRVGVIVAGSIVEIATPATLGGRNTAQAIVSWRHNNEEHSLVTANPTQEITRLAREFSGEIPELRVSRPSLEDIYLHMIATEDSHE
jgi:ABC-2 type transport system ATP-binding protein